MSLQKTIEEQAARFAEAIVAALRGASLDEIVGLTGERAARGGAKRSTSAPGAPKAAKPTGRLGRRTADDIRRTLDQIVNVLGKHESGLRAEQIKAALGLDKREMPKPIGLGLKEGVLQKSGEKRATVYSLAPGSSAPTEPASDAPAPAKRSGGVRKKKAGAKKRAKRKA
jgi:hypothetical protein